MYIHVLFSYIGHKVDSEGLHPLPDQVCAIVEAPCSFNPKQLNWFNHLLCQVFTKPCHNFYLHYINCYTKVLHGNGKMSNRMHLTSLKNCSLVPIFSFNSIPIYQFCWHAMHPIIELKQFWHTECQMDLNVQSLTYASRSLTQPERNYLSWNKLIF